MADATPTHDEQGRPLLPDDQFHALVMMDEAEYDKQSEDVKQRYVFTSEWHFKRRMGDLTLDDIVTGDGMTATEKLAHYRAMQSQKPDDRPAKDY